MIVRTTRPPAPLAALVAVLVALLGALLVVVPGTAHAASGDAVDDLAVTYDLQRDGSMKVTETYRYRFAGSRHGMTRYIVVRQGYTDTQHRQYPMSDLRVSSPSGAPDAVQTTESGGSTVLRIGNPDRYVSGMQTYVVSYTLGHVINAQDKTATADLYWNVTGDEWSVPIQNVTVKVTGPAAATKALCYWGATKSTGQCGAAAGTTSTFTAGPLSPHQQMTVAAQYPRSAFGDLAPQLADGSVEEAVGATFISPTEARARSYGSLALGIGAPLAMLVGLGGAVWRRGRDERYADIAPGIVPGPGENVATTRGGRAPAVAVRFTPPDGATPGLIGTIVDERADALDVSATVLDLAVRGFLRIEQVDDGKGGKPTDWRLVALREDDGTLLPYERTVLDGLFILGTPVLMSDLRTHFASTLQRAQGQMYSETVRRGWFRESPALTRQTYSWLGWLPLAAAVGLAAVTFTRGGSPDTKAGLSMPVPTALIGIAGLVVAGGLGMLFARRMPARTATGSAVLAQAQGFREYLLTAEAGQIAFEEAANIFSRYLPYAVVFGCADRWAKLFAEVAAAAQAQGIVIDQPTFFVWGYGYGGYGPWGDFGRSMDSFATSAAGTFTATPGSTGDSPFSGGGGGGFGGGGWAGGGGGGGGGGSW